MGADEFYSLHFNYNRVRSLDRMEAYIYGISSISQLRDGRKNFNRLERCNDFSRPSMELIKEFRDFAEARGEKIDVFGSDLGVLFWKPAPKAMLVEFGYLSNRRFRNFMRHKNGMDYYINFFIDFIESQDGKDPRAVKSILPRRIGEERCCKMDDEGLFLKGLSR